jgi:hypothetical protein
VSARDNRCPHAGTASAVFSVKVMPKINLGIVRTDLKCGRWKLGYTAGQGTVPSGILWKISKAPNDYSGANVNMYANVATPPVQDFQVPGKYLVTLTGSAVDNWGETICSQNFYDTLVVDSSAVVFNRVRITGPDTIHRLDGQAFQGSINTGYSYAWSISSGNISNGQGTYQVFATFATAGTQQIKLVETGLPCGADSATKQVLVTNATGLGDENAADKSVHVYPNPTNGKVSIELETTEHAVVVEVFDITGKLVLKHRFTHSSGLFTATMDLSALNKGMYMLRIMAGEKSRAVWVTRD